MLALNIFLLIVGIFILVKATDYSISLIEEIGLKIKIPAFILSSVLLAMATSFPELFVGIVSAVSKEPVLSLGNVLGSNLVNLTLIVGVATVISNGVKVKEKMIFKDLFATLLIAFLPYFFLFDGLISRKEGLALVLVYFFYQLFLINGNGNILGKRKSLRTKAVKSLGFQLLLVIIVLAVSAQLIVVISERLSSLISLPLSAIGVFILALGTSIPELVVQLKSSQTKESGIFFGNVLGSVVVNSGLVLGVTALIYPIKIIIPRSFVSLAVFTLLVFAILPVFLRSKKKLERNEGLLLIFIYLLFILSGLVIK